MRTPPLLRRLYPRLKNIVDRRQGELARPRLVRDELQDLLALFAMSQIGVFATMIGGSVGPKRALLAS